MVCNTALSLSSNSPLYFAPATSAPISSENIWRSFKFSGTSPRTIRSASPSAIAVLPTPGSPISTGLFFVLRERIRITFLISVSLPMTGSSLFCRASSVKSCPYFLSTSYVSSGFCPVTRTLPLTCSSACKNAFSVIPHFTKMSLSCEFGFSRSPMNRCSTEIYSSFICFAFSSAAVNALSTSGDTYTFSGSLPLPVTFGIPAVLCSVSLVSCEASAPIFFIS